MAANPALLPELVRDSKLEATTIQDDLTIHAQSLGRRRRTEKWKRREVLGHGGYGVVWLEHKVEGDDAAEGVCRAVKVVRNRGRGPMHYARELEALAKFSQDKFSDFFVKFLGWYENPASDYLHIAMEYCPHGDLKNYLAQNGGKLPENEVRDIASQVLAGVVMMHRSGFANRDIKPANILIKSKPPGDWWVKICDFGLSKRAEDGFAGATTTVRGTPEFMPPEILGFSSGFGRIDPFMVDMWCLGETVFQALTGQPVFGIPAAVGRYLEGSLNFPIHVLRHFNASGQATSFITALMRAWPLQRMTSEAAIRHPWMVDMTLEEALRAPEAPNMVAQSTGTPYRFELPQTRASGDQLTQASGQWTTTMTLPSQPSLQQQGGSRSGNPPTFRPIPEPQSVQPPYYVPINAGMSSQRLSSALRDYQAKYPIPLYDTNRPNPYAGLPPSSTQMPMLFYPYARHSPSGIPYQAPAVAPSSSSMTPSDPSIIYSRPPLPRPPPLAPHPSSRLSTIPAYRSPSSRSPSDFLDIALAREHPPIASVTQLIRRKTKSINAKKCSILSHLKTIKPLPGENWDDNDGLKPSHDVPLDWQPLPKSGKAVYSATLPNTSTKMTSPTTRARDTVREDVLKEFKAFAAQQRKKAPPLKSRKESIDREVKIASLKEFASRFKLDTPVPSDLVSILRKDKNISGEEKVADEEKLVEEKKRGGEIKVVEDKKDSQVTVEAMDIPSGWRVVNRRKRGRK